MKALADESYSVADMGDSMALWWHTKVSLDGVRAAEGLLKKIISREGKKIRFITIVEKSTDLKMPPEVRQALSRMLQRFDSDIAAAAVVFEASGFQATAVRSIVTAINLTARNSFPNKVFSNLEQATTWIVETSGGRKSFARRLFHQIESDRGARQSA